MTDVAAVSAAVLYAVAILMLFGVRSWQQYRATGAAGFNGFRSKAMAARVAGTGFVVALVAGVLSPVLVRGHVLPTLGSDSRWAPALAGGGASLALAGILMAFAAQATMGTSWRIGVDTSESTDLVTHGLFAGSETPPSPPY